MASRAGRVKRETTRHAMTSRFLTRMATTGAVLGAVVAIPPKLANAAPVAPVQSATESPPPKPRASTPAAKGSSGTKARGTGKAKGAAPARATKDGARRPAPTSRPRASRPAARRAAPALPALRPTTPQGEIALAADLATLLQARVKHGEWGVIVASISRGDTLFSWNADTMMLPASTLKLYTTALAFDRLGTGHQFRTEIRRDGEVDGGGTLAGSLYLLGGGDPALSGRFAGGSPDAPMRTIARQVAATGIRRVTGDLVGDASAFDGKRIPDGWLERYLGDSYAARVSALSLNENLLSVVVTPAKAGEAGKITLQPATVAYKVVNRTVTQGPGRTSQLVVSRTADGTILVRGTIGTKSEPRWYSVVVDDPALFATGALRAALEREGITIEGNLRLGPTPPGAAPVAAHVSPPLSLLASAMNRESINHFAELVFRNAARGHDPLYQGSAERGNVLLRELMVEKAGARWDAVNAADGSGLSTLNRITPRSLVQLLGYADRAPWSREFHESLPVAGRSELLRHRMTSTPAQGNLHAKTGTTSEVIGLGGYVTSASGELLAFTFLYNGKERWQARETIDAMGATLAGWSR